MIAEQLKKSILQAAIQGKLTEQLPEDGDARDLLKEIQKEKARLVKEGKIRKEKPLPEITEDEIPFDIPDNWCWVRLKDIVLHNIGGGTPSKSKPAYWNGGIPWASVKDLNCKFLISTQDNISEDGLNNSSSNLIPAENLIICTRMGLGKIVYNKMDVAINQDLRALILSRNTNKWYVYYFYLTLNFMGKGATVKGISVEDISNTPIPLPPLVEQNRIVDRLEGFLSEIDKLKNDEVKLEELQKSFPKKMKDAILQYAIQGKLTEQFPKDGDARDLLKEIQKEKARLIKEGKIKKEKLLPEITEDEIPFEIPENWCWVRLGDIIDLKSGQDMTPDKYNSVNKGIPYITGASSFSNETLFVDRWTQVPRSVANKGDLLITCKGTVGEMAFLKEEKAHIARQVMAIRSIDRSRLEYILIFLKWYVSELKSMAKSMIPGISREMVLNALIPLPPIKEQKKIVERIEALLPLCEMMDKTLQKR